VSRPDWDEYFLGVARAVAARADCSRRQVGAVLVDSDRRLRGSGYNGARPGGPSCLAGECPRGASGVAPGSSYDTGAGSCVAIHAELNLVLYTSPEERKGGAVYVTDEPCDGCLKILLGAGLHRIVWPEGQYVQDYSRWSRRTRRGEHLAWVA
jgi:dCMP deaminase